MAKKSKSKASKTESSKDEDYEYDDTEEGEWVEDDGPEVAPHKEVSEQEIPQDPQNLPGVETKPHGTPVAEAPPDPRDQPSGEPEVESKKKEK